VYIYFAAPFMVQYYDIPAKVVSLNKKISGFREICLTFK
jgi:hypothetical protein